jgi:hypothetical protein
MKRFCPRWVPLAVVGCCLAFSAKASAQGTLTQILDNGPRDKRINIVFLSEAYTAAQQSQFNQDAINLMDYMLGVSPFNQYAGYFNVFTIWVASDESGSDHPWSSIYKDTYFSSSFDCYGLQRLLTIPPNDWDGDYAHGVGRVYALLATHVPEYDVAVIIANDPEYGGSGGSYAITSVHASAPDIVTHELGHSYGYLGDEYESAYDYPDIEEPNTTMETNRDVIKWNAWIAPTTPIPTPETVAWAYVVGLFEGAHYHSIGWYRPMLSCRMRALGYQFCDVCQEQLIRSTYEFVSPIESYSPPAATVTFENADSALLSIVVPEPSYHSLDIQWYVDGEPVSGASADSFWAKGADMGIGSHEVMAKSADNTALVRTDPAGLLTATHTWAVEVTGACCVNRRGNANGDAEDKLSVADVTFLLSYLFGVPTGPAPACTEEANANGDALEKVNVTDVTFLLAYMFGLPSGPQPPLCPEGSSPTGSLKGFGSCKGVGSTQAAADPQSAEDCLEYGLGGNGVLYLKHINAAFNCCPVFEAEVSVVGNEITITEIEVEGQCNCLCLYDVSYEITGLAYGQYHIVVNELNVYGSDQLLDFTVDLSVTPSGRFCVPRNHYPWDLN